MIDKLVVFVLSLKAKLSSERGQDVIEYAILSGLIALALVAVGVVVFQTGVTNFFKTVADCIDFSDGLGCP